jgi:hypothetical protein
MIVLAPARRAPSTADIPDAAEPEHRHLVIGRDLGGIDDGADPGEHGAAEQRPELERQLVGDPDRRFGRHHGVVGERRDAEVVVQRVSGGIVKVARAREERAGRIRRGARLAERGAALPARPALAARGHERDHDVITGLEALHSGTRRDHRARGLMAEEHRHRPGTRAVDHGEV